MTSAELTHATSPSIAISIPAWNEQDTLEQVVRESLAVLQRLTPDYEVVIIDDGSRDQTGSLADRLAQENPHVRVLHHAANQGFGVTLREVYTMPRKEWIFFIPGDGQIPPGELETLWPHHTTADVILGWRLQRHDAIHRRMAAFLYNVVVGLMLRRRIHDVDSAVLFRRALLLGCSFSATSAFFHAEFCSEVLRSGAVLTEVPIRHQARLKGQAKGFSWVPILQTFRDLFRYVRNRRS